MIGRGAPPAQVFSLHWRAPHFPTWSLVHSPSLRRRESRRSIALSTSAALQPQRFSRFPIVMDSPPEFRATNRTMRTVRMPMIEIGSQNRALQSLSALPLVGSTIVVLCDLLGRQPHTRCWLTSCRPPQRVCTPTCPGEILTESSGSVNV